MTTENCPTSVQDNHLVNDKVDNIDYCQSFYFQQLNARGVIVRLSNTWRELCLNRNYPLAWEKLLGEMATVSVFFAAQLKQNGRFGLQIRSSKLLELLLIDCDSELRLRGAIRAKDNKHWENNTVNNFTELSNLFTQLQKDNPILSIILDHQLGQPLYQSQVPFLGKDSSEIISNYISESEQQENFVLISSNEQQCAAFFLYKLPEQATNSPEDWQRVRHFASTLQENELLTWSTELILKNLFSSELENENESIRLLDKRQIHYFSPRDQTKVEEILRNLGLEECQAIIKEKGNISIDDDIGNHHYHFTAEDLTRIFANSPK